MKPFFDLENNCAGLFESLRPLWHLWTPEDNEIIFRDARSYKAGISILAICAKLTPKVKILTFELMSNHLHITASGPRDELLKLFMLFRRFLRRYFRACGSDVNLSSFDCRIREIVSLEETRNVIAYNNRNGFVISPDSTPFSFPWGANPYYYNPHAKSIFANSTKECLSQRKRRKLIHSHYSDGMKNPPLMIDGYACPLDFCFIGYGERLYRNAAHYFRDISKNIESQKRIAEALGERMYFNDDDLFAITSRLSKDRYGQPSPGLLQNSDKIELAKTMHFDYNANCKQIARILKVDRSVVEALFPNPVADGA